MEACTHIKINHYNNTKHIVYITEYDQRKHAYDKTEHKTIPQTLTKYPQTLIKCFSQIMQIMIKYE